MPTLSNIRAWSHRLAMLLLMLCLPLLGSCEYITQKIKERNMPAYEIEKFNWGINASFYSADMGVTHIEDDEDNNIFLDAQGQLVKRWYGAGGGWGIGGTPMGGNAYETRLPKTMQIAYYDYMDEKFYRLRTEIPTEKIYNLFKQKTTTLGPMGAGRTVPRYDELTIGIGPKGYIMLWANGVASGGSEQVEIGQYWAQERTDMTVQKYNNPTDKAQRGFPILDRWLVLDDQESHTGLEATTIAKLKAGWTPSPEYYQMQRVKYPWRYAMTGNAQLVEYGDRLGNQEKHMIFARELSKANVELKGVPQWAWLFFNDRNGGRHSVEFNLYDKNRVSAEPDLSEVWAAYHQLFPNRRLEDNDQAVPESEFATLEVNVSDDLATITVELVKGNQRIPLQAYKVLMDDLTPGAFFTDSPPLTLEQQEIMRSGPQTKAKVKIGAVCPRTGLWQCLQLEKQSTLYMRQGDIMPGASYKMHGYDVDNMYWEWVKDA